ncbi:hypothetical protein J2W25_002640 [Variovorax boronicumulans]|uniref:DUF3182 domain-containing protein n=1 Tax=Variovorax boronicumulans TaxID=436515 RepID=A0AAW8DVX2_9BURK|nr:DUF3182 family protein [Variovorax boronicumulans]MDP9878379.1 hypothetical protein [Variovorax boronicumulans]MDP9916122.1 hypothetical protein [Variovorax boronicumulans]MDP9923617.1 hypothetical protein [Variovorax boronicumulans]PBI94025.1 hypothetical protein BKP43_14310 [Variovorax boronicumulans]
MEQRLNTVMAPEPATGPATRRVVTWDVRPQGYCSEHEHATRANVAQRLAALQGWAFAGAYDASQPGPDPLYFVPSDTLTDPHQARAMGIAGVDDLFGGVVPHAFVATKAISHPLIGPDAVRPLGWSARIAVEIGDAALPGFTCFSLDEARVAGRALLDIGRVRLKPVTATGGRGQQVVDGIDALEHCLDAMDDRAIATEGLVLETNLEQPQTYSVGQLIVAQRVVSYCGEQRLTRDNAGQEVYGGSDLLLVRGDFDALLARVDPPPPLRRAIEQARRYHRAVIDCYPDFFASRVNYDVAQGLDGQGDWRSGVLEQSWRVGGATGAEIAALEAFHQDPACQRVHASCFEVYGEAARVPAGAIVAYQGNDPEAGPLCKYTVIKNTTTPHADTP